MYGGHRKQAKVNRTAARLSSPRSQHERPQYTTKVLHYCNTVTALAAAAGLSSLLSLPHSTQSLGRVAVVSTARRVALALLTEPLGSFLSLLVMAAEADMAIAESAGNSSNPSIPPSTAPPSTSPSSRFPLLGSHFADVFLFHSVTNTSQLVALFNRHKLNAALINPALVPATFPLLTAATKTAAQQSNSRLTSQSIHHQLLFNLAPSTHIQTAIARFTPDSRHSDVLLVTINQHDTADVIAQVQGVRGGGKEDGGLDGALRRLCNVETVKKLYKVAEAELMLGGGDEYEALQQAVTCRIAIK